MASGGHEANDHVSAINPYTLLDAVNAASQSVNTGWLMFLALMAYALIAVAGVTHADLLLETPVVLPILQVAVPLRQFFIFTPLVLVLFHLGIVAQLVLLARKSLAFNTAVRQLELDERRTHPLRLELHNFFFLQAVAGPQHSRIVAAFLHGMSWLTTVILPVLLLLYIQLSYLPAHDRTVTAVHRFAIVFDLVVLFLMGAFLLRPETSFFQATSRNAQTHPVNVAVTSLTLLFAGFIAFFVATIPGEMLDRTAQILFGPSKPDAAAARRATAGHFSWGLLTAKADGTLFGMFPRNLIVTDRDLVVRRDGDPTAATLNLRGRDLRYARLERSDLHKADMTGANLTGARLDRARLSRVTLVGAEMAGASFEAADLTGADMNRATATAASFAGARLDAAMFGGGFAGEGASFAAARLEGADMTAALLHGADFTDAKLGAVVADRARLDGAMLTRADLSGASLTGASLLGADLSNALITAADVSGAAVWRAVPPRFDASGVVRAQNLKLSVPAADDKSEIKRTIDRLTIEGAARERLLALTAASDGADWSQSSDAASWQALAPPGTDGSSVKLTDYLAGLLCRPDRVGFAIGILRRAERDDFAGDAPAILQALNRGDCGPARDAARDLAPAVIDRLAEIGAAAN